ncbi:MAG TPA: hypothetical protein DG084_03985, partial [Gemmatimonadetes bacterium]|nr:hypothetical protein [Gemmatimonadota bacterium]
MRVGQRWRNQAIVAGSVVGFLALFAPAQSSAQDIEALAHRKGVAVPEAYYQRVQEDPTAYEFERALFRRAGGASASGEVRIPVILGLFVDSDADPHITREMVEASLFEGPAERGTITESYLEMSRGALTVSGDV